ncbi:MAG TPA: translocation/assembly module TamB domain-containing protein, partial [bacterium]|nr:translocation/assembly module TamB domain-containing protein [bacterium]
MDGSGSLALAATCPRLEDLYGYHKLKNLGGEVAANATVKIAKGDVAISASSLGRGIDYAGAYLESLMVDVNLTRRAGRWGGWVSMLGSTVDLKGFKAGEIRGDVAVRDTIMEIRRLAITRPDGDLVGARGAVTVHGKDLHIRIEDLAIQMAEYVWQNRDPVQLDYVGGSVAVSSFEMGSEMGKVSLANSTFGPGGYKLDLRVADLDLGRLEHVVGKEMPTGTLSLTLDAAGTANDLQFDLGFDVKGGEMRSVKFADLGGSASYSKGNLAIKDITLHENGGNVVINGAMPLDLTPSRLAGLSKAGKLAEVVDDLGEVTINVTSMDISVLSPLAPPLAKLKGLADVELTLSGRRDNPVVTSRGRLGGAYYGGTAVGDVSWDLALRDSALDVKNLGVVKDRETVRLAGTLPLAVSLLPFASTFPARPMDLTLAAENGALDLLCEIFPKFKVCSGNYGANLKIGGTVEDPTFTGSVNLADARLRFEGVPQEVEGIYVEARAQGKRFEVTKMAAFKGALKATGFFALEGVKISDYDFRLTMKDLAITEFEDFYVVLTGDISIKSQPVETVGIVPNIEGAITVQEGEYYYTITSGARSGGGGESAIAPEAAPKWLMNLGVEIPHDFWVRGSDIDAELQGSLNVKKGAEGLSVLGTMQTIRGTFYIYNNDFKISKGEFRFADVKSLNNVYIDLEATSRVLDERIDITATGKMENLNVTATSETGWSETQIFEALTLRRGATAEGAARGKFFSNEFLRSWGVALVNRFGSGVARELRLDQFGVEVGDGTQGSMLSATRVTLGKYVSDKVYLQYTQALGSLYGGAGKLTQQGLAFPERQFQVEYRLSDRLSMDGEAGTVGGLGYFDVDLKFTYGY